MADLLKESGNLPVEEATERSRELADFTIESAADPIFWVDSEARFHRVNEAACRSLGYSREELLAMTVHDIGPDYPEEVWPEFWARLRQHKSLTIESRHRKKDGRTFPIEVFVNFIEFGGKEYYCGIVHDITQRRVAEKALKKVHAELERRVEKRTAELQESERKFRNIFDNAQVGLFRTQIADGKILEGNDRLAQMFGYKTRVEFVGECILSKHYVQPETRARLLDLLNKTGEVRNFEASFYRIDGSIFWVRYSCRIYSEKGYIEGVAVDITDQKKVEEALKQAKEELENRVKLRTAELEAVAKKLKNEITERKRAASEALMRQEQLLQADRMASLGFLVSGVAHEINNPNGLILMNLPTLNAFWKDAVPVLDQYFQQHGDFVLGGLKFSKIREQIPQILTVVQTSAVRIKRIVGDLKHYTRSSDPSLRELMDLNSVVRDAVRLVANTIKRATDHFAVEYGNNMPKIHGNSQRIEQVVVNLILNACQALENREKEIFITTHCDPKVEQNVLEVRDHGIGIAKKDLPHLLDPFFTTRREAGGTGLGLSVSSGIVQEHGGTLTIHSRPGEGTSVLLSLPVSREGETS